MIDTKALREKILDLAIRGKLVPQDPNDEPASVLLERIRAQKQQMVKEGKLKAKDIKNDTIIFKGEDNLHYEQFQDGTVKCIEDEIPFDVPDGWAWTRLGVICPYGTCEKVETKNIADNEWILDLEDIEKDTGLILKHITKKYRSAVSTKHRFLQGQLLYSKLRPYLNKVVIADQDGYCTSEILPLDFWGGISPLYMQIYLMSATFLSYVNMISYGVKMPRLGTKDGEKVPIALPPLRQQVIIAKKTRECLQILLSLTIEKDNLKNLIEIAKSKILDLAIRGKLVPQDPNDEPASLLLERIKAEKEELIKQGKIKRDKKESVIFKGEDNSYYEKIGSDVICIDAEIPFEIPDTWKWMRLENCCIKEIRRGKSPKYVDESGTLVFAQKCNTKYGGIDMGLALFLDESTLGRYPDDEYMQNGDVVINSTGTGTLGRVGIYHATDNYLGLPIVPDSHVTVIRAAHGIQSVYVYGFMKANQSKLEKKGEGSTNQKELKPPTLKEMLIPIPPYFEQERIVAAITAAFSTISAIEKSLN